MALENSNSGWCTLFYRKVFKRGTWKWASVRTVCSPLSCPPLLFCCHSSGGSLEAVTLIRRLPLTWKRPTPCHCLWDPRGAHQGESRGGRGRGHRSVRGSDRAIVARILRGLPEHPTLRPCASIPIICLWQRASSLAPGKLAGSPCPFFLRCHLRVDKKPKQKMVAQVWTHPLISDPVSNRIPVCLNKIS